MTYINIIMGSDLLCLPSQLASTTPLSLTTRLPLCRNSKQKTSLGNPKPWRVTCSVSTQDTQITQNNRRSANYQPNLWNFEFLQSLENDLEVETVQERATKLEEEVRSLINRVDMEPLSLLELIDNVQRLGLTYMFEKDINKALAERIVSLDNETQKSGLHATALRFRLLRQHGFEVSQDVFESFKDKEVGSFKDEISSDVQGMLSLYEASYLGFEGENVLDEARAFSATHLKNLKEGTASSKLAEQVSHALELPYHRRLQRLEARWFIERYEEKEAQDGLLLELAKLEFNRVQSLYKKEVQELSRWWWEIGLASKLEFVRDRLMEVYFWAVGMAPDPELGDCRKAVTKMFGLVTIIDDVYDVYGTLEELQLFTDAVERWDVMNGINTVPDYMKLCFLALYNTVNDTAYSTLKQKGVNILPYLAKSWSDLCKAFLQEAKWSNTKRIPSTLKEYIDNASISSSGGALLVPSYFTVVSQDDNNNNNHITKEALDALTNYHGLLRSSCTVFRLCNDLATSAAELERGETTNSITLYMQESGSCEEELARERLRELIDVEWKKLNRDHVLDSTFPTPFKETAINMARVSHCTYQYGDGLGRPDDTAENRIKLLLLNPIPL